MHRAVLRSKPYRALVLVVVATVALTATITLLGSRAEAVITDQFTTAFSANVNGSIVLRGNTNMVCPASAADCTNAQAGTGGTAGVLNNNNYVMEYADADGDAATFNDSTATVALPAGSKVLFAGLYWSADPSAGANGSAAPSPADQNKVRFRTPAGAAWQPITASKVYTVGSNLAYQGFADVTPLVSGAGNGVYSVANIQAGTGRDRYAGWALVLAYQNAAEEMHSLRVFDGFGVVSSSSTSVQIPLSGFQTPSGGTINASIGTVVYEGDLGLTGDTLVLDSQQMSDSSNPANNFFNSTVSQAGAMDTSGRSPANRNLMGVDIDHFDATGKIGPNVQNAQLTLTTGGETFYPGVVTFTTDLFAPDLKSTVAGTDLNGGDVLPGDVLEYRIDVTNVGDDTAKDVVLSNAIPTHTTYVPGSLKVGGAGVTDATGDDTGQVAGGAATWGIGASPNGTAGGSLVKNATGYVTFRVTVDTDAPAGYQIVDLANTTGTAAFTNMTFTGVPASKTFTVQQPHADLAASVSVSPATVQRAAGTNPVGYTVVVTNNGADLEPAAVAKLTLPTGVTAGTLPSGCTVAGAVVTCAVGSLVTGSQATRLVPATADATAAADAVATLRVSGNGLDAVPANDTATTTLTVNAAPQAANDTANTTNGAPVSIDVRRNDSDSDDATADLTVTLGTAPAHGNAVVQANGTVTYTPTPGWTGTDSFGYTVSDGNGGSATATVTVTTANAAPVANDDVRATAAGTPVVVPVLGNDTDPNGNALHVASITQPPAAAGTATLAGDQVTFAPAANFAGTATFTYTVEDSLGARTVGQIRVSVANTAPTAADDTATAAYRGSATIDVLGNDTDANGDTLTLDSVGTPDHGTATIAAGKVVYQAPAGFSGDATFTYVVGDGTDTATAHVTVTVANAPPVAADESVHTACDTAVRIDVLADARDPNTGDTLRVSGVATPANGSVVRNADGTLTYTPNSGWSGTDTFDYDVEDGRGGTDTATVTVVVTNGVPVAGADSITVDANTTATVDVLANDTDPNRDRLTVTVDTAPAHGTAVVAADGTITYTPAPGYHGPDSFHYTVSDGRGGTDGATVTVGVVNSAPDARDDAASTDTDTAVTVQPLGNDTDRNTDDLTVTAVTAPAHGTAVVAADGTITYTPAAGWFGTDAFTYSIADRPGATDSAVVTVTVRNAAPIAVDDRFVVHPGTTATLALLTNDRDPNTGQALSVATVGSAAKGTVTLRADGTVTYRPNAMTSGSDTFDYVLTDDLGRTDTATVTVVIDAVPTAATDAASTAAATAVDIAVTGNDTDPEGRGLTLVSAGTPAHGTAVLVDGKIRYTPVAGFTGTDTFTYVIRDGAGTTATGTVTVAVGNAVPVAGADPVAVLGGRHVDVDVLANDTDANPGQDLTVTAVGTPAHGTAVLVDGKIRYTPAAGFTGTDTFTYTVGDGNGGTSQGTVTVTVSDGTAVAVPDHRGTPYQQAVTIAVLDNDLDPDGTLTVTAVGTPDHGTAAMVDGRIRYTPPAGFTGVATFSYTATDSTGARSTAKVTVTVGAPPVVPNKSLTAKPGTALRITLPTVDEHGTTVQVRAIGKPKHGTATLHADGTVTYVAAAGFAGTDSFTYEVVDADGNLAEGTITIKVAGTNTRPVATNDLVTVDAGDSVVIRPLTNDKDADRDELTVVKIGKPRHGTAVLNPDGTVTYAPFQSYAGGVDSFVYTISDGHGGTTTAIVTVMVNAAATGGADDNLAKTGLNVVAMVSAGGLAVLVGGFLLMAGGIRLRPPAPMLAAIGLRGPGRHRPGRHRD